ncbi:MAG: tetratricopeptide repeat protein [Bacteroidetes bacterium]|nr:tetratricopeptide repeat protein [Bacteroidota bacterium]
MRTIVLALLILSGTVSGTAQDFIGKAKGSLTARDTAAAIAGFQDALKANQKPAEAGFFLGAIAFAQGRTDDAIRYLDGSVKIDDENAAAFKMLGDACMVKKDLPGALTAYRQAERLARKDPAVLSAYGLALVAADSIDNAIRVLTLAKEYDEKNVEVYKGLGAAYAKQGVAPMAVMNYQKAIELAPQDIGIRLTLGNLLEKQRQYTEAVKAYDGIIAVDSTYAQAYLEKGEILVLAKLYAKAIPPLRTYVTLNPKGVEGSQYLAKALFGAEEFAEAAKAAKVSLDLDSNNVDVWRIHAHSLAETKDYTGAIAAFGGLQRRNAFKAEDQGKYGIALYGLGREDEALNALLAAVETDSTNCDPYFSLGSLYMKKQEYDKAAQMFEKRIVCDPRSLSAYINASASYMQIKDYQRSHELLTKAVTMKPDFLLGRLWLGRTLSLMDSLDEAKAQYDLVLTQAQGDPAKYKKEIGEAHYMSASYWFQKQQYEKAIDGYRKAQASGYDNADSRFSWGQAVLQTLDPKGDPAENKKRISEAVSHFRRSVEMNPNNYMSHLWLAQGLVLMRVEGDDEGNRKLTGEACEEYRKVLRLNPGNADAKKGMERISCPGAN